MEDTPTERTVIKKPLKYEESDFHFHGRAPPGYPHIISSGFSERTDIINLRAADGVATLLYRGDHDALIDFLDLRHNSFEFIRQEKGNAYPYLMITRCGRKITVRKKPTNCPQKTRDRKHYAK